MIASLNTSTTENVEKASDDEVSGSNEEMSGSALPASAGMMSSEASPVEGTLENKEDELGIPMYNYSLPTKKMRMRLREDGNRKRVKIRFRLRDRWTERAVGGGCKSSRIYAASTLTRTEQAF
ncbi:hypothetical protein Sjap_004750 [Stephania japonica]|uniref:Uncharacterized protein n=1 Tax=Stephania japonica TaxID=461633 RepID=A0AAP0PI34_9MAGN